MLCTAESNNMKLTYDQAKQISDRYAFVSKNWDTINDQPFDFWYIQAVKDVLSVLGYDIDFDAVQFPETLRIVERQGGYVY